MLGCLRLPSIGVEVLSSAGRHGTCRFRHIKLVVVGYAQY